MLRLRLLVLVLYKLCSLWCCTSVGAFVRTKQMQRQIKNNAC